MDLLCKIVLIGDSGVGKSNLMTRYSQNDFTEGGAPTIGVEFMTKSVKVQNQSVKVQIWDTAGQERFQSIARAIYHGAKGCMVVYDITSDESFSHVPKWLNEFRNHMPDSPVILVGNKCDLSHLRSVSQETAMKYAKDQGISFLETSAKDHTNVEEAFTVLIETIHTKPKIEVGDDLPKIRVKVEDPAVGSEDRRQPACKC